MIENIVAISVHTHTHAHAHTHNTTYIFTHFKRHISLNFVLMKESV